MVASLIRWGILGAGNIADKLARAVDADPNSELMACASRTPGKAKAFAKGRGIDAHADYESLLRREDIDVVYVATTHNFHVECTRLALEYDKPVLLEKPFTVNAHEAAELIRLARQRQLFLMEAIWTRYLPAVQALKQCIQEGYIGELRHATVSFGGFAPPHYLPRLVDPALAGGVTLDMGIYPISLLCYVTGERPSEIQAQGQLSDSGVDEVAAYHFRFPGGATASVSTSFQLKMKQEAMFYGRDAYIEYPNFQSGPSFRLNRHKGGPEVLETEEYQYEQDDNGFVYQVAEVVRCLRSGKLESEQIPWQESLEIMAVMDEIRAQLGVKYPFE
jgi:predicted dehydrogenase